MWKFALLLLLSGCGIALRHEPMVTVAPEPANYAWWLRIEFRPTHTVIRGTPVRDLDASWRFASELEKELIPRELLFEGDIDGMEKSSLTFTRMGDFDRNGAKDLAIVGVYEDHHGGRGNFILILTRTDSGPWRKLFLSTLPGRPGFAALARDSAELDVSWCMACDHFSTLVWDNTRGEFSWKEAEQ